MPKASAIIPRRRNTSIHADHVGMCKFQDSKDPNYMKVSRMLQEWAQELKNAGDTQAPPEVHSWFPALQTKADSRPEASALCQYHILWKREQRLASWTDGGENCIECWNYCKFSLPSYEIDADRTFLKETQQVRAIILGSSRGSMFRTERLDKVIVKCSTRYMSFRGILHHQFSL